MLSQRLVMTFKAPPDVVTRTKVGRREPNTRNRRRYGRCRNTGKDTSENTDDAPFFLSIMDINKCFFLMSNCQIFQGKFNKKKKKLGKKQNIGLIPLLFYL